MVSLSRNRKLAARVCALGIGAATLAGFTGGALADGPHHGPGRGFDRSMHAPPPPPRHEHHGHRHGGNGAAVALGIGALFLGAAIASEASRRHADRYDE